MDSLAVSTAASGVAEARRPTPRLRLSVVMVVYRTGEALGDSLDAVLADPRVDELVIVDNGSTAAELDAIRRRADADPRLTLLSGHGNIGFARGANLGARRSSGELLVFLNPDAFLQPGCVTALADEVTRRPGPCLVGARILNADRTEQRGGRRGDITPASALFSLSGLAARTASLRRFEVHWEGEAAPSGPIPVPTISGACFCLRRRDFDAIAGFDEGYFLHVEDVDLCWRMRRSGGEVLFHPAAEVVHIGGTSQTSPLKVEFHKGMGLVRFFHKRAGSVGERLAAWTLGPVVVGAALLRPLAWRLRRRRKGG